MNDQTRRKLDQLDVVYPPERLTQSRARWQAIWQGTRPKGRYPFTFDWSHFNPYDIAHSPAERVQAYLDGLVYNGQFDDDLIPSIFPGLNHASIPSMFGAGELRLGIETTSEKLIHRAEDIDQLPEPSIRAGSAAEYWVRAAETMLTETEGRIGIHVCDMQGPFDVCAQLWSYDQLILCAYEDPARYHRFLSLATEAFIMLWRAQQAVLGEVFIGTHLFSHDWVPANIGATLSADGLVMCSPDFYREFMAPYITRVAEVLGGVTVHSCGNFLPVLRPLCATPGVKGINASQLTISQLVEGGLDPAKTIIAFTNETELPEIMREVRAHDLHPCLTIHGFYPFQQDGTVKTHLSSTEQAELQARIENIHSIMSITDNS